MKSDVNTGDVKDTGRTTFMDELAKENLKYTTP